MLLHSWQARSIIIIVIITMMMMMTMIGAASTAATAAVENEETCTLNCPFLDAPCKWSELPLDKQGGGDPQQRLRRQTQQQQRQRQQHCACPPGWTGLLCQTKYESCSTRGGSNSDDRCYHGGRCVEEAFDDFGNPQLMCDCSTAQTTLVPENELDGTSATTTVTRYVGKYCEHAMEQQCDIHNEDRFCVNGGDCNPNVEADGIACLCPTGYHGYHCEYEQAQVPVEQYCSLDCANGGTCVLGLVNPDQVKELEQIWGREDVQEIFHHMRCLCPPGFGGPLCQARQEICGKRDTDVDGDGDDDGVDDSDQSHSCYHGGQCVTTTTITNTIHGDESLSQTTYHCDCTTALDAQGNRFTGDYCQVKSTVFCDNKNPSFFCTHGGTCPKLPHEPCLCPEGYEGHKCEYATTTSEPTSSPMDGPISSLPIDSHTDATSAIPIRCGILMCLHGSQCSTRDGVDGPEDYCDCSTAYRPDLYQAFAGKACQYQATTICPTTPQDDDTATPTTPPATILSFCVHYGQCRDTPDENGSQCACPEGWTGPHCEFEASLDADTDNAIASPSLPTCGDTVCYHGGMCVETTVTVHQGDESDASTTTSVVEHYCDCSQAYDDQFMYAGRSCEYPSTSICDGRTNNGDSNNSIDPATFFCTNHGTCLLKNLQQGCMCRAGFSGFHCEYLDVEPTENDADGATTAAPIDEEPKVNQCDDSLFCRNGGTCVTTTMNHNGVIRHVPHCDCSTTATDSTIFAGPHCEHAVTTFCTDPFSGESPDAGSIVAVASAIFCVQGGTCRDNVFEGCDCPVGWTGFRCEYPIDTQDLIDNNIDDDDNDETPPPVLCGDMVCYNGGTCATFEQEDPISGALQDVFSCDCSNAATTSLDGVIEIYGGRTCSTKSTSLCQEGSVSGVPSSSMVCMNHGICREDPNDGCDCPPGFTGKFCDLEVEDDSHKDQGVECGDSYCYHGGTCASVRISQLDGEVTTMNYCDCTFAVDEDHLYAGNSCQHKSTSLCTHPAQGSSLLGTIFCVNGGTCREGGEGTAGFQQGCDCPPGWTGFSCEFPEDPEDLDNNILVDLQSCGENVCLNGGKCVTTRITEADGNSYDVDYCDCNMAYNEDHLFAGPNCEFPSSILCTDPDPEASNLFGTSFCVNGGTCHPDHVLGECSCQSHWTGFRCEFPVEEETADNSNICSDDDDGFYVCHHGGRCGGDGCDCDSAIEGGLRYDGVYCQFPATEYCDNPYEGSMTLSLVDFCVNGGKCQEGDTCACPTGYYGPRCEMTIYPDDPPGVDPLPEDHTIAPGYNCRLSCANGGSCVKGAKDGNHGVYDQAIGQVAHLNMTFDETLFEHCVCPPGFVGLLCEHVIETCGGGRNGQEHYCLHGSKCVYDSSDKPYCDCEDARARIDGQLETTFGGASCQHPASDICLLDDPSGAAEAYENGDNRNKKLMPLRPLYFCVNQGLCRNYVSEGAADPGCDCPADWIGPHCEIHSSQVSQLGQFIDDDDNTTRNGPKTGLLVWTMLLLVIVLFILIFYARRLSRKMTPSADGVVRNPADDAMKQDEDGVVVSVDAMGRWSSTLRHWFLVRRTKTASLCTGPKDPATTTTSVASLSSSNNHDNGMSMNLAPTRRSTLYMGTISPYCSSHSQPEDPLEPEHASLALYDGIDKSPSTSSPNSRRSISNDDRTIKHHNSSNNNKSNTELNDTASTMESSMEVDDDIDIEIELL